MQSPRKCSNNLDAKLPAIATTNEAYKAFMARLHFIVQLFRRRQLGKFMKTFAVCLCGNNSNDDYDEIFKVGRSFQTSRDLSARETAIDMHLSRTACMHACMCVPYLPHRVFATKIPLVAVVSEPQAQHEKVSSYF